MDKINLDDYEEISEEEYYNLKYSEIEKVRVVYQDSQKIYYFKKKSKDIFEDREYKIVIKNEGNAINIIRKEDNKLFAFYEAVSLPLLEQAIEEAKRRQSK